MDVVIRESENDHSSLLFTHSQATTFQLTSHVRQNRLCIPLVHADSLQYILEHHEIFRKVREALVSCSSFPSSLSPAHSSSSHPSPPSSPSLPPHLHHHSPTLPPNLSLFFVLLLFLFFLLLLFLSFSSSSSLSSTPHFSSFTSSSSSSNSSSSILPYLFNRHEFLSFSVLSINRTFSKLLNRSRDVSGMLGPSFSDSGPLL